jgi:transcriptional regulator with XRE-family HTH domain
MTRRRTKTEWEIAMGIRLKKLRQKRGLSQGQLAKMAGIPKGSLLQWEYGKRTPLFDAAVKLADALHVTLDELAGRTPPVGPPPEPPARKKAGKRWQPT